MVHSVIVLAPRKPGITHEEFKRRYEQHMLMIADLSGDAAPLSHSRSYIQHDADDKPSMLAGDAGDMPYDCVVRMDFEDEAAFGRFVGALSTEEAAAKIEEDEAGFWDRTRQKVVVIGDTKVSKRS